MFTEDFTPFFQDFAQAGTLAGVDVSGILSVESLDEFSTVTQRTTFLLKPTTTVGASAGQVLATGGVNYTVRQVLMEPPDGALKRLVLARA